MVVPSVYLFNILCAMVPCTATQPPPEAYIQEFSEPLNNVNKPLSTSSNRNIRFQTSPTVQIDPVLSSSLEESENEENFRPKRLPLLDLGNVDNNRNMDIFNTNSKNKMTLTERNAQLNSLFPTLFGAVPAIPAFISSMMRTISSATTGNGNSDGRSVRRNIDPPLVFTKSGGVEGYYMGTMKGRKISAFEGIPFAEKPIGELRFKSPVPKSPWEEILQAKKTSSHCLQAHPLDFFRVTGNEDCLYLNIFTKTLAPGELPNLPVIFFIHGGSFQYGSGSEYGPSYLLDEDIILVTFNYRLGPLGFLSTGDEVAPGNFGLKDQALALKWVHENIHAFGGNASLISIMGQSAGAVSAHMHLIANKTTQYFQNGVSLSGSSFGFWTIVGKRRMTHITKQLAAATNCPYGKSVDLVKCLRKVSGSAIIAAQLQLYDWIPFHPLVLFAPTIEPEGPEAFLTKRPEEVYANNEVMDIPWIFGQTSQEGHFDIYSIRLMMQGTNIALNGRKYLPKILDYEFFTREPRTSQITSKILRFYGGRLPGNGIDLNAISDMYSDRHYTSTIRKAINAHSAVAPTYAYIFDHKGKYNVGSLFGAIESDWGVSHTEDLFYFFNSSVFHHGLRQNDPEYTLSQIMTNLLANFATKKKPVYVDQTNTEMDFWKPVSNRSDSSISQPIQYLKINKEIKMVSDPFTKRIAFWDSIAIPKS